MAISGPAPSQTKKRRNADTHEWQDVVNVPYGGPSPELPDSYEWGPACRAWYSAVRSMPHCVLWTASDWMFALETAFVANEMWAGNAAVAGELRQRNAKLGVTLEDRMKLRIRYRDPEVGAVASAPKPRSAGVDPRVMLNAAS